MDADAMLAHELENLGLVLREWKVPNGGIGLFAAKSFGPTEIIGTYYLSLHYDSLFVGTKIRQQVYGEVIMAVDDGDFPNWGVQLKQMTWSHASWIYPAPFCVIWFINNAHYTDDDSELTKDAELKANPNSYIQNNVTFLYTYKTGNVAPGMRNPGIVRIKTTSNTNEGDGIYLYYGGNCFSFHELSCKVY